MNRRARARSRLDTAFADGLLRDFAERPDGGWIRRVLATRDLVPAGDGDTNVLEQRIAHAAARLAMDGRLWDERDAD